MNQHSFWWSSLSGSGTTPTNFINVTPNNYSYSFESGLSYTFEISGTTGYTITTGASWLSMNSTGGTSGITYVTGTTVLTNSGTTDWTQTVVIQNLDLSITTYLYITQTFEPQPELFVMTEGGEFVGELV
jgi:non-ribosomal peptide synthetase component E (peptide arylation enzyme)